MPKVSRRGFISAAVGGAIVAAGAFGYSQHIENISRTNMSSPSPSQSARTTTQLPPKDVLTSARYQECIVCEKMCPVPQKAIRLEERIVVHSSYEIITPLQPTVVPDLCIGCGICEYKCPLDGEAAIRIYPTKL